MTTEWIVVAIILVFLLAYLVAWWLRVHRLRSEVRRTTPIPPDGVLSWTLTARSHERSATNAAAGAWVVAGNGDVFVSHERSATNAPAGQRPSLPQTPPKDGPMGLAVAFLDGFVASLPSIQDLTSIDWNVVDGVHLSAAPDLSQWTDLAGYLDEHYFAVGEPDGFLNRLIGYVGEVKAGHFFEEQGAEVIHNESPNVPGYDLLVNGQEVQVKVGNASGVAEHLETHPEIPVVTGPDNLHVAVDHANVEIFQPPGSDQLFVAMEPPDLQIIEPLDADAIRSATTHSLGVIGDDFGIGDVTFPYLTAIRSSLREIGLLATGDTDLMSAGKYVALDTAGVGIGGWAGAKGGAIVGSGLGPVGMVVGGLVGAISMASLGKLISGAYRRADFRAAAEKYRQATEKAQANIRLQEHSVHGLLTSLIELEQHALTQHIVSVENDLEAKLAASQRWFERRCIDFVSEFPKILDGVESKLLCRQYAELAAISARAALPRLIWPAVDDVRYWYVRAGFRWRLWQLRRAKSKFSRLARQTPLKTSPQDAVRAIQNFAIKNPFESADFDHICRDLRKMDEKARIQQQQLTRQANDRAQKARGAHLARVRGLFQQAATALFSFINGQTPAVDKAKEDLLREARKAGINLGTAGAGG